MQKGEEYETTENTERFSVVSKRIFLLEITMEVYPVL